MKLNTTGHDLQGGTTNIQLNKFPDQCPVCHRNIHPKNRLVDILLERELVQAIYRCTHQKCQELFIGTYRSEHTTREGRPSYILISTAPKTAMSEKFSEPILELSATFVEIYNQSIAAESQNLSQLVGIGLRKSLEFLIKDFLVTEHPEDEEKIRSMFLGKCIDNYIEDTNVKACAKRAAWLGNDETHYTKKWVDKDVNDLKLLVRLTVNWIENVILTKRYISEMDEN